MGAWDDWVKMLVKTNPQHFVSFVLKGAHYLHEQDKELKVRTIEADFLYNMEVENEECLMLVEVQRRRDGNMGKRIWEYGSLVSILTRLAVYAFVIYLRPGGSIVEPPYSQRGPDGKLLSVFYYENIKLWEIEGEVLKQAGLETMLPLLPLTKDGASREVVEDMITCLLRANQKELLPFGYAFAGLVLESSTDKEWLKRRFNRMSDTIKDSWVYQDLFGEAIKEGEAKGMEKGMEKGMVEELRSTLSRLVSKHYPELASLARQKAVRLKDPEELRGIIDALFDVKTVEEARLLLE